MDCQALGNGRRDPEFTTAHFLGPKGAAIRIQFFIQAITPHIRYTYRGEKGNLSPNFSRAN